MVKRINSDTSEKRDKSKFYRFHEEHGHMTDDYKQLKDEIE